ncbi:MAG: PAP2 family protein [Azospirillum brasilense]|uniref:Phosphatase PAP2 family protein n=1 Tax=Roseomonas gilardii TaxID=257708 RepID=A0A1L7AGA3_9PROT|nr:phosphatase PAP2 family protein [Roseomonas gilardii]APT57818.1 phosphoesterase [Roseomonas gilardii]MDT8333873.1 phosphatase PAP2 family protein [Roseomonas gilardii]PZP45913.1 MAG: PAP2 family protein [Azospirillum brasilense]
MTRFEHRDATPELPGLLGLLLVAGGLLGFVALAALVHGDSLEGFDRHLLLLLRDPADLERPIGPHWLPAIAQDVTALGSNVILVSVSLVVLGGLLLERKRGAALLTAVSILGGTVLSLLVKLLFERPRPDVVPHMVEVFTASFPSGHAMLSAVTYLTLGALMTRIQAGPRLKLYVMAVAVAVTLLVGASRIYLGVHWPTDVLAGWCLGSAWALSCWLVALRLQRRGQVERPGEAEH